MNGTRILSLTDTSRAKTVDLRFKGLKAIDQQGVVRMVHAPDRVGGIFQKPRSILIQPLRRPGKVCSHRLLAWAHQGEWTGANPSFSEEVAVKALEKGLIPGYRLIKTQVSLDRSRLDALCHDGNRERYVQIKGVNVIIDGHFLFPSRSEASIDDYRQKLQKSNFYTQSISPRALKHGRLIGRQGGLILYVILTSGERLSYPLELNQRDQEFIALYRELDSIVLRCRLEQKAVYAQSVQFIKGITVK